MNFFARQDQARAQTRTLVVLFAASVAAVVVTLTGVLTVLFAGGAARSGAALGPEWWTSHAQLPVVIALAVLAIVLGGAGAKSLQLRAGGSAVARSMGGDLVDANTRDPLKRRLLNVVEEMAIASGVPVPAVYVMEGEPGINAFAAGNTVADAAIAVTRGTLERLDRNELQGVIGHEFSHVLNGDMRLNMTLLGFVAGLFAIAQVGRLMLRGSSTGRSRKGGGGIALAGLVMMVLGFVGMLLGRMLQSAISRQREYLADASAVQFTRDPQGLRDALVRIGAASEGSHLGSNETSEVAHMLFASGLSGLFATHPPLVDRIRALDPSFRTDEFEKVAATLPARQSEVLAHAVAELQSRGVAPLAPAAAPTAVPAPPRAETVPAEAPVAPRVGNPRPAHLDDAARRLAGIPPALLAATESPAGAARVLWGLVLGDAAPADGRARQALESAYGVAAGAAAEQARTELASLAPELRLPLVLRLIPVLARIPEAERERWLAALESVIAADGSVTPFEYALARLARVHLRGLASPGPIAGSATLLQLEADLATLLSVLARAGHSDPAVTAAAFERGVTRALPGRRLTLRPEGPWASDLDAALDRLDRLRPADKARLVDALGVVAAHDRRLDHAEDELLRAVCGSLHCPLPPFAATA